jgi:hypothetical protein
MISRYPYPLILEEQYKAVRMMSFAAAGKGATGNAIMIEAYEKFKELYKFVHIHPQIEKQFPEVLAAITEKMSEHEINLIDYLLFRQLIDEDGDPIHIEYDFDNDRLVIDLEVET